MTRVGAVVALLPVLGAWAAGGGPTPEQLVNGAYSGILDRPVRLVSGEYEGPSFVAGGASRPTVTLLRDLVAFGDLDADGTDEALVVLVESGGGSGSFLYLAVVASRGGRAENVDTVRLGDRLRVRSLAVRDGGTVHAELLEPGTGDAACCPSTETAREWRWHEGALVPEATGGGETSPAAAGEPTAGFRLLPIPVVITEPAIGEGLGVCLTLFHPPKDGAEQKRPRASTPGSINAERNERRPPPVSTAVFGAYTSNHTWAAGIAHSNHFRRDTIRYTGAVAFADVTSDFYVAGAPIGFSLEGAVTYQDLRFRIGHSRVFVGSSFVFLDATNSFEVDLGGDVPETLLKSDLRNAGLSAEFVFEGRDNSTMPTRGQLLTLKLGRYDEALGGDYEYWNATLKFLSFHPLHERFVLGLRLQAAAVDGSPPFFGYPWVTLRGVPAMRYQDKWVGALELEGRFLVAERWSVLGFGGIGFKADELIFSDDDVGIHSIGAGVRRRIFKAQDVWVGVDFARGPEDWNWYLQVNQAW